MPCIKLLYPDSFLNTASHNGWERHSEHEELIVVVKASVEGHSIEYTLCTQKVVIRLKKVLSIQHSSSERREMIYGCEKEIVIRVCRIVDWGECQ